MNPEHDLIRALANAMRSYREFARHVPTEEHAEALVFHVLKTRCGFSNATRRGPMLITPEGAWSLKSLTFRHTKLSLRVWLAAIWHLHVDEQSMAARVFGRRYEIDKMSAWRLLGRVRAAFLTFAPTDSASTAQSMGHQAASNEAWCISALEGRRLFLLDAEDAPQAYGKANNVGSLWTGYFETWLATVFRGVLKKNQAPYAAEFVDRFGRRPIPA